MFLHIEFNEDGTVNLSSSEHLKFEDALRLLGTTALSLMKGLDAYVKDTDAEHYDKVHGHIYDTFNILSGNILDAFDNTRTPATDLTAEAILRAENAILDEAVPSIEPEVTEEIEVTPTQVEETEGSAE